MDVQSLALGPVDMLREAIFSHCQNHRGQPPKRFELHPAVWMDLCYNCRPWQIQVTAEGQDFEGIPVVIDKQAIRSKLITCDNEVEYL